MAKKTTTILVSLVAVILVAGGIWAFYHLGASGTIDTVEETSNDGFVTLSAEFGNDVNQQTSGVPQALIGGTSQQTGVIFTLKATNTGEVGLSNVRPTNGNANIGDAFGNVNPLSSLAVGASQVIVGTSGQSCSQDAECEDVEYCSVNLGDRCAIKLNDYASGTSQNNVDFTISITGDYSNAQGQTQSTTSSPVTLTYDVRDETCSDGTTINSCVFDRTGQAGDKPDYCLFVEDSPPQIVEDSDACGCPAGEQTDGSGGCVALTCADGTPVNTCSTTSNEGTYGAYYFCKADQTYEPRCNQCGATDDFYGNENEDCSPSSGEPSSAVYKTYEGGISGSIGEG